MKTLFIQIRECDKAEFRKKALDSFYIDQVNTSVKIYTYINQPEGYFKANTRFAEIRFYQSAGQPEPYRIEYYYPFTVGAVVMRVNDQWVIDIWNKLEDPDGLRAQCLNTKKLNYHGK